MRASFVVCAIALVVLLGVAAVDARQGALVMKDPVPAAHPAAAPAAAAGEGSPCRARSWVGTCTAGPCSGGQKITGACKGSPANVRCCILDASAKKSAAAAPAAAPAAVPAAVDHGPFTGAPAAPAAAPHVPAATHAPRVPPAAPHAPLTPAAPAAAPAHTDGAVIKVGDSVRSGAAKVPGTELAFPFPYSFPYGNARHIVSDFSLQRIRLYDGSTMVKEWKMSSGKNGIGFAGGNDSAKTPSGRFVVYGKVGGGHPLGEIIDKRIPTGRFGRESDRLAHMQTRLLLLDGKDPKNKNTKGRSIYIHGTNKESLLGTRQSHGCFRMANKDVVELFDAVTVGTEYFAVPFNAWP